ncbi:hypothetical protein DP117_11880 [Brasilonema sp. UFV-L1]|nr:hypothetical protein [Brasilonema sp. UFV-L1]
MVIRLENLWKILTSIFDWLLTFSFLTVTWIFFKTPNYDNAMKFINRIFDFNSGVSLVQFHVWQLYIVFFIVFMMNFAGDKMTEILCKFLSKQYLVLQTVIVACLVYIILRLGPDTVPPFIYFNF